jgi:hypothetical protein
VRNDARPIGPDSHQSPVAGHPSERDDRHVPVVDRSGGDGRRDDSHDDPVMPADDATLRTKT